MYLEWHSQHPPYPIFAHEKLLIQKTGNLKDSSLLFGFDYLSLVMHEFVLCEMCSFKATVKQSFFFTMRVFSKYEF